MVECDHKDFETRKRTIRGGGIQIREQCLACGEALSSAKPHRDYNLEALPAWDEDLQDRWWEKARHEDRIAKAQESEAAQKEQQEWWSAYDRYLVSQEWRLRRARKLARDTMCEGCHKLEATAVHHLSYEHVGNEFDHELLSVCKGCHDRLHDKSRDYNSSLIAKYGGRCTHCGEVVCGPECPPF